MLRPEYAVAGYLHHAVAHGRADKHAYRGNDEYALERGGFGADGGIEEVDGIVAHAHREVKQRQQKQEDDDAKKQ